MALTAQQLAYLKNADQRFRAHIGIFAKYEPTVTTPTPADSTGTLLTPTPLPRISPRYSLVAHSGQITLDASNTINRNDAYVGDANVSFALQAGSAGSIVDNGNGTGTYTAPGTGSGTDRVEVTVTNSNGSKVGYAFVQYPKTTYDDKVAEIASISGNISRHGWQALVRVRGDGTDFAIGKLLLLHIEDTWESTTSTFGGFVYAEGVFVGYISEMEYFEDAAGETWLGLQVSSPWWLLSRTPVGETHWGQVSAGNRFYIGNFRPADAIWHFCNEITDFSQYHDVITWNESSFQIDDLIIDESDLATIFDDVSTRTLNVAYCDRYGSLFNTPDLDVHADWWGTLTPIFDSGGAGPLTEEYCSDYTIQEIPYSVRKLTLAAYDKSKRGIYAISEATGTLGEKRTIRGLICDDGPTLAQWAVQKRAQLNRPWTLRVGRFLDHTVDLLNLVDVSFTSPSQGGGKTASGETWVRSVTYRPNVFDGGWVGQWELVKRTYGDGTAETGATSAWGGTGLFGGPVTPIESDGLFGGGWAAAQGGPTNNWCYVFNFDAGSTGSWDVITGVLGSSGVEVEDAIEADEDTARSLFMSHEIGQSTFTYARLKFDYFSGTAVAPSNAGFNFKVAATNLIFSSIGDMPSATSQEWSWSGEKTGTSLSFFMRTDVFAGGDPPPPTRVGSGALRQAVFSGSGNNPFGADNC